MRGLLFKDEHGIEHDMDDISNEHLRIIYQRCQEKGTKTSLAFCKDLEIEMRKRAMRDRNLVIAN
ncbi:MAG: hypothetical protein KGJ01_02945 [Patescibacteria group bacterium]|nr:hypothetical protein [Patescibacteria group bacterium]